MKVSYQLIEQLLGTKKKKKYYPQICVWWRTRGRKSRQSFSFFSFCEHNYTRSFYKKREDGPF